MSYVPRGVKKGVTLTEAQQKFIAERKRKRSNQRMGGSADDAAEGGRTEAQDLDFRSVPPLGMFTKGEPIVASEEGESTLKTWTACKERERRILRTPLPKNFLEEMTTWTEKGVLWHFPIDNEQGIEEVGEARNVSLSLI